jgi:hypothetical protein
MNAVDSCVDLGKPSRHIDKVMNAESEDVKKRNRLRIKATVETVRWLAYQADPFRGRDKSEK